MFKIKRIAITAVLATMSVGRLAAQAYAWRPMSMPEAQSMLRNFAGDPGLEFTHDAAESLPGLPDGQYAGPTFLHSGTRRFAFNLALGSAFIGFDETSFWNEDKFYGQPYDSNVLARLAMSQQAAQSIGEAYMQSHFPAPQILSLTNVKQQSGSGRLPGDAAFVREYQFLFEEKQHGVTCPSNFTVNVDTVYGKVVFVVGVYYPTLVSLTPKLTVDQAYASAFFAMKVDGIPIGRPSLFVCGPDELGVERLAYRLEFFKGANDFTHYSAGIDAHDGAFLGYGVIHGGAVTKEAVSPGLRAARARLKKDKKIPTSPLECYVRGNKAKLSYPPLLINSRPYFCVEYLNYGKPEGRVVYGASNNIELSSQDRKIVFNLKQDSFSVDGRTKTMAAPPVIVNSRCYVPLDIAGDIAPFKVKYNATDKKVNIDVLATQPAAGGALGFGSLPVPPASPIQTKRQ